MSFDDLFGVETLLLRGNYRDVKGVVSHLTRAMAGVHNMMQVEEIKQLCDGDEVSYEIDGVLIKSTLKFDKFGMIKLVTNE